MKNWCVHIESRLPWNRRLASLETREGVSALEAFRAAGFTDDVEHVLFVMNGAVCLDGELLPDGAIVQVFPRMHGG